MTNVAEKPVCEGCLEELDVFSVATGYGVCMECTEARHKAVLKHKCRCGRKKRESEVKSNGSRKWISCLRCLGQVRQIS